MFLVTAYSPLGSPERAWAKPSNLVLLEEPKIAEIPKKYSKSAARICIKWQLERSVTVVPKSFAASRIQQNANVRTFYDVTRVIISIVNQTIFPYF